MTDHEVHLVCRRLFRGEITTRDLVDITEDVPLDRVREAFRWEAIYLGLISTVLMASCLAVALVMDSLGLGLVGSAIMGCGTGYTLGWLIRLGWASRSRSEQE